MERYEFCNKVWVSEKGRYLDRILWLCGWILLILNLIMFVMEGTGAVSIGYLLFIVLMLVWVHSNMKNNGKYVEMPCVLTFGNRHLIWEYPSMQIRPKKDVVSMKYFVETEEIIGVQVSNKMKSIRLACMPTIEYQKQNGTVEITDCAKKQNPQDLILYCENIEYIQELIRKYLGVEIDMFD